MSPKIVVPTPLLAYFAYQIFRNPVLKINSRKLMKKVTHISMSPAQNDARVNRAVDALNSTKYDCILLSPGNGFEADKMNSLVKLRLAATYGIANLLGAKITTLAFWSFKTNRQAYRALIATKADIIHAHDWDALPIGVAAGKALGIPVIYDSHEFASQMHQERWGWRIFMSPAIEKLERSNINECAAVITVSEGIAKALKESYKLAALPTLIRNIPEYQNTENTSRNSEIIMLHYHGILARGRGIELAVSALARLPGNYILRLTGPWRQPNFESQVIKLAELENVADRLQIKPALSPGDLVQHASEADIGLCILPIDNTHNRYALPNKLFEYIAAGLCCIVSNGDDMANIVNKHGTGIVLQDNNIEELVEAILGIDTVQLSTFRRAGLKAAKVLCWEQEKQQLLALYNSLSS